MSGVQYDAVICGAGAVGLAAAIGLARVGFATCLVGPEPGGGDGRTAALLDGSLALLSDLGLRSAVASASTPLKRLRIVDDTGSLFRPPPVEFDAAEIGLPFFGRNIENATLLRLLAASARTIPTLTWLTGLASGLEGADHGTIRLADGGALAGTIVVAADGRNSRLRHAAGITARDRRLPQAALTAILRHGRDHGFVSTELHRRGGPFTLVPLEGHRSSLVWVDTTEAVAERAALDDAALGAAIETASRGLLGTIVLNGPRGTVPLGLLTAERMASGRLALVGEAGHALPPIGAQGLNLGFADVAALVDEMVAARAAGHLDGVAALARYARRREGDVRLRSAAVEGLNAALLRGAGPLDAARGLALGLIGQVGPLRRAAMRAGLTGRPSPASPRIAR